MYSKLDKEANKFMALRDLLDPEYGVHRFEYDDGEKSLRLNLIPKGRSVQLKYNGADTDVTDTDTTRIISEYTGDESLAAFQEIYRTLIRRKSARHASRRRVKP